MILEMLLLYSLTLNAPFVERKVINIFERVLSLRFPCKNARPQRTYAVDSGQGRQDAYK